MRYSASEKYEITHQRRFSSAVGFHLLVLSRVSSTRHPYRRIYFAICRTWHCSCHVPGTGPGRDYQIRPVSGSPESDCHYILMFSFENLLCSVYEKILLLRSTIYRGDYHMMRNNRENLSGCSWHSVFLTPTNKSKGSVPF